MPNKQRYIYQNELSSMMYEKKILYAPYTELVVLSYLQEIV